MALKMKTHHLLTISIFLAVTFLALVECSKDVRARRPRNRFLHRATEDDEDTHAIEESNSDDEWVSDNSDEILVDGDKVLCLTSSSAGGKFSAVWKSGKGVSSGDHYWEITLDRVDQLGEVAVGFTNDERFNKDGKTYGILYGGNLGNGQDTLVEEYGPRFKTGDKIGLLASYDTSTKPAKLEVYFYHNKQSLGLAFKIDRSLLLNARPMIQFGSSASASIAKKDKIPSSKQRSKAETPSGIVGTWRIDPKSINFNNTKFNPENIKNKKTPLVTLSVTPRSKEKSGTEFTSVMRVHNEIRFRTDKFQSLWTTQQGVSSTKQNVPDSRLKSLENNLLAMTRFGTLSIYNYKLVFKKEKTGSEATFDRYEPKPQPVSANPFNTDEPSECTCPCSQY